MPLDAQLAATAALLKPDDYLLVVSDHGAKTMQGGFAINQWLLEQGYLHLRSNNALPPATPFSADLIDWPRTQVWADGGYVARLHLNIKGREPQGCVEPQYANELLHTLRANLLSIGADLPTPWENRVVRPEDVFPETQGIPPALFLYLDDLRIRALASFGHPQLFVQGNDQGPDDANHADDGILLATGPALAQGQRRDANLLDIAPTILHCFSLPIPAKMRGRSLLHMSNS